MMETKDGARVNDRHKTLSDINSSTSKFKSGTLTPQSMISALSSSGCSAKITAFITDVWVIYS